MQVKRIFPFLLLSAFISINLVSNTGCANIVPPGGGPKDTIPPVLVGATPKDSALRVSSQKITLYFDEFVEMKNANEKILITPYPDQLPQFDYKLRTVTVRLKDSLLPNTTYTIDFGDAIADLNEGNILKNFKYVFSTGSRIDNNTLSGKVILAETGKADSTTYAVLYTKNEDSTVMKEKPKYVTRVDSKGNFRFSNLPEGTFYVFALLDSDGDKKYGLLSEAFAFYDQPVVVSANTQPVALYAYVAEKAKRREPAATPPKGSAGKLYFNASLENGHQNLLDSMRLMYIKPIRKIDPSKIKLLEDTTNTVKEVTITNDSVRNKLVVFTQWKAGASYKLVLPPGYATDSSGNTSTVADTLRFSTFEEKDYGSIRVRFTGLDLSRHPVLLVYRGEDLISAIPMKSNEWYQKLFLPGDYQLRILFDANENGRWDAGSYFTKPRKQPELVQSIDKPISIKSNWDNEFKIDFKLD